MNDNSSWETKEKGEPKSNGRIEYKESVLKTIVDTQEDISFTLQNGFLESDEIRPKVHLSIEAIKAMKPGLMRKYHFEETTTILDPKGIQEPSNIRLLEIKKERMGVLYVMINHNYRPRVDPKDPKSTLPTGDGLNNSGMSRGGSANNSMEMDSSGIMDSRTNIKGLEKLEARKWIYEEFKPQKPKKISLGTMDDKTKEMYLNTQTQGITKLRDQKKTLKEHLDILEDKLDETLFKMKEKKKAQEGKTEEELARKKELDIKFSQMKQLQKQASELKEQFTGGGGFDKLKDLENKKKALSKNIKELEIQVDSLTKKNIDNTNRCEEILGRNDTEVG